MDETTKLLKEKGIELANESVKKNLIKIENCVKYWGTVDGDEIYAKEFMRLELEIFSQLRSERELIEKYNISTITNKDNSLLQAFDEQTKFITKKILNYQNEIASEKKIMIFVCSL